MPTYQEILAYSLFGHRVEEILQFEWIGNSVKDILIAVGLFLVLYVSFKIFRKLILIRFKAFAESTETKFDDEIVYSLEKIHPRFYNLIALYFALKFLTFNEQIDGVIHALMVIIIMVQAIICIDYFATYVLKKIIFDSKHSQTENTTAFNGIKLIVSIVLWVSGLLLILSNLGFNITSLAASLGIGGVAVALAVQNILGDLFSSFSIYFDQPFELGDFIIVGNDMGNVEKIGLKSTRIRTLQGEELVISNRELTSARVQNFKKMETRRICFNIGVTYDTSSEKLKQIPQIIESVFEKVEKARLDRVHFKEFADFSLNFEIVYFHLSSHYHEYMETRQEFNFMIKDEFEKAGIDMAFPTQTLHVSQAT